MRVHDETFYFVDWVDNLNRVFVSLCCSSPPAIQAIDLTAKVICEHYDFLNVKFVGMLLASIAG
eukprot:6181202-Pleurochrysis_carterae.AAC.2